MAVASRPAFPANSALNMRCHPTASALRRLCSGLLILNRPRTPVRPPSSSFSASLAPPASASRPVPSPGPPPRPSITQIGAGREAQRKPSAVTAQPAAPGGRVAYLGPEATYSNQAALALYGDDANYLGCASIAEVVT